MTDYPRSSADRTDHNPDDDRHTCDNGWTGEDHQDRPIPCPTCRPHLHRRHRP